jgi:hypothetical protein
LEPLEARHLLSAAVESAIALSSSDPSAVTVAAVEPTAVDATLLGWGLNVYQKTNASLKVPGSSLYAETASLGGARSGGDSGFSFVWPAATQFRVLNALVRIDPTTYRSALRAFADELHARYWRSTGMKGYRSGVSAGAGLFYDDNGHLVVALAEAYQLTRDPVYLARAMQAYDFVLSGEDAAGGGGIYFREGDHGSKDAISTLQAVRAGLLLYQITGTARYLADARRVYGWAKTHIQQPDGLFRERFALTGPNAGASEGFTLINSAGIALSANLLFYDTTGDVNDLREAQRIAGASLPRYFNGTTGAINDEGFWAFELVDGLDDLSLHDRNPAWVNSVKRALVWLHANREDPNGHYGTLWGRGGVQSTALTSWDLNNQAAVAQSYLYTAADTGLWTGAELPGRSLFYNSSVYDNNDPAAGAADDGALATDKAALLPGASSTFANVSTFARGINGVMIDFTRLPAGLTFAPTAADFVVRAGNTGTTTLWAAAPAPSTVTIRPGAGAAGGPRVTLTWPDNALKNTWVQVTVLASSRTGLSLPDVFYFGSLPGDADGNLRVNALDVAAVKQALNGTSTITGRFDFNRDGRVNALDVAVVKQNLNRTLSPISATAAGATAATVSAAFSSALVTPPPDRAAGVPDERNDVLWG